jgi:hypothetical protein
MRKIVALLALLWAPVAFGQQILVTEAEAQSQVPISGLPPATLPLKGTELVPLVQNSRTVQTPINNATPGACVSAISQGFVGDGVTDNTTAWSNYKTTIGSANACLVFGAGVFVFNSAPSPWTLAGAQVITIQGAGPDVTEFYFPNANNGFVFSFTQSLPSYIGGSALNFYNASVTTGAAGGGDGIKVTGNNANGDVPKSNFIKNVTLRGHVSTGYWTNAINLQNVYQFMVEDVNIFGQANSFVLGTGILFNGADASHQAIVLNVSNANMYFLGFGINATGFHQGVSISQSNITGVNVGVQCGNGSTGSQCQISSSQIEAVHNAVILNLPGGALITNNLFIQGARAGTLTTDYMLQMTTSDNTVVSNNIFAAFNTGSGSFPSCVDLSLGDGNSHSTFTGNSFSNCTTTEKFSGASTYITSTGNTVTGTPIYTGLVCNTTSNNVIADSGTGFPLEMCGGAVASPLFRNIGAAPTIAACGTGSSVLAGSSNQFGIFTTGSTGPTTCTLNFAAPHWSTAVNCIVQSNGAPGATAIGIQVAATTTQMQAIFNAGQTSQNFVYLCNGN